MLFLCPMQKKDKKWSCIIGYFGENCHFCTVHKKYFLQNFMYVHKIYGHRVFFSKYLDILKYVHRTNGASTPIYGQRKGIVPLSKHACPMRETR
jgi:hypothetical protein